jgi:hypothetical protein
VLNTTASGALSLSGNASINIPGNLVVDSSSKTALTESGNASITAASIQAVGGVSKSGNATLNPAATTGVAVVADPLAGLLGPSTVGLTNHGSVKLSGNKTQTINPGIYSSISASGNTSLTLNPGVYLIEGGGFTVSSNASVTGTGVTLYNTGSNFPNNGGSFGGITLSGNGTFSLTAPSSGPYAGVVIFQAQANTRALSLSGNAAEGLTGTVSAPAALLYLSGNATVQGSLDVNELSLSGNAASTQSADGSDVSAGDVAGQLLAGDVTVYVNDPNSLFTADELARIQDAVNAVDAVVEPYGVSVTETTDSSLANVIVNMNTTSAVGGYADGILGCWNPAGEITMIRGWNWYAGSDPTQIGASQYDFQTTLTHELGHALGLGESNDLTSAMNGTLAPATVIRTLTTTDLNIPYDESGADAQRVAPGIAIAASVSASATALAAPTAAGSSGRALTGSVVFVDIASWEDFLPLRSNSTASAPISAGTSATMKLVAATAACWPSGGAGTSVIGVTVSGDGAQDTSREDDALWPWFEGDKPTSLLPAPNSASRGDIRQTPDQSGANLGASDGPLERAPGAVDRARAIVAYFSSERDYSPPGTGHWLAIEAPAAREAGLVVAVVLGSLLQGEVEIRRTDRRPFETARRF